jgi:hypothetical protein
MAQTNAQIIFMNSLELMDAGTLKSTGRMFVVEMEDGTKKELPEPQPIHTFAGWKARGYKVKKGEHAIAKFPIWKMGKGKIEKDENGEDVEKAGRMFMKLSFFFSPEQVEPMKAN